ncbi:hypothetical protein SCSC_0537 [Streptococcus constellatus subsp. constellatus]|nr:hypothetical protein SCSC_0537 [Streptococcus constellatus subsp. constellatus]
MKIIIYKKSSYKSVSLSKSIKLLIQNLKSHHAHNSKAEPASTLHQSLLLSAP